MEENEAILSENPENTEKVISDIEKNKELFEYEMTEVILQLRGEFAKMSGKDMNCDIAGISVEKPDVKMNVPDIKVESVPIDTAGIPGKVDFAVLGNIPELELDKGNITAPEVPDISAAVGNVKTGSVSVEHIGIAGLNVAAPVIKTVTPQEFKAESESIEIPEVRLGTDIGKNIEVEKTTVDVPGAVSVPDMKNADIKVEKTNITVPEVKAFGAANIPPVSVERAAVEIPDTKLPDFVKMPPVAVEHTSVDIPDTKLPEAVNIPPVAIERTSVDVPTDVILPPEISITAANIEKPDIHIGNISAPAVPELSDITLDPVNIGYPQVGAISADADIKPVTVSKTHIDVDTEVPKVPEITAAEINVDRTDIGAVNIPAAPSGEIPEVEMQKNDTAADVWSLNSSLPEGYQEQLDDILKSVIGSL